MSTMIVEPVVQDVIPTARSRVSWGAILAGVTVALVAQLLLGVLGLAPRGVSRAAFWTVLAMLIGLGASAFGGYLGSPDENGLYRGLRTHTRTNRARVAH